MENNFMQKTIYRLEAIKPSMSCEVEDKYILTENDSVKCYREQIGCFSSVEKAENVIKQLVQINNEEHEKYGSEKYFGFELDEIGLDDCFDEYKNVKLFESRRTYLSDGTLNCFSDLDFSCKKKFSGRDEPQKVKNGDYALLLTYDAIIPILVEETSMTKEEWAKNFKEGVTGDFTDDSGIAFSVSGGHDHPFAPNVFPCTCLEYDIFSDEIKNKLKIARYKWLNDIEEFS